VAEGSADQFEVICIGAGTVSEGVASELQGTGTSFAVIERELVGGECPYWGCIPSKTLLRSAEVLAEAARARELAASRVEWDVDFPKIAERTHYIARNEDDTKATEALVEQGATIIRGEGRLTGPATVVVGDRTLTARRGIVIGTGTSPAIPPIEGLDRVAYWTNREATLTRKLPRSLLVLGSGPIGAELAQAFGRFGTEVHVIEALDRLIPGEEPEASAELAKSFEADGIGIHLSAKAVRVTEAEKGITLHLDGGGTLTGERLLVAVGRRPKLQGIDLGAAGIGTTEKGWIKVDDHTLLAAPGIWAGGDITGIGAFTHLSWYHGKVIGRQLKGERAVADHRAIPRVTFTDPEIASVGLSEANARRQLRDVRVVSADSGNGTRGYINGPPGGVIKLVADMERNVLVGALVVGPRAGEMIAELTLAIRGEIPLTILEDTLHAFPTFSRDLDGLFPQLVD
jgi:pyruvate/2-oxoglutarate dehydrogenase complex dihydrolipoamide dehydrogenase (E3) component